MSEEMKSETENILLKKLAEADFELAALRARCEQLKFMVQQNQTYSPKQSNKEVPRELP